MVLRVKSILLTQSSFAKHALLLLQLVESSVKRSSSLHPNCCVRDSTFRFNLPLLPKGYGRIMSKTMYKETGGTCDLLYPGPFE